MKPRSISGIYRIRIGSLIYVGQSKNIHARWQQHQSELEQGCHHNQALLRAYRAGSRPHYKIVDRCPGWQLNAKEAYWRKRIGNCPQRSPRLTLWSYVPAFNRDNFLGLACYIGCIVLILI